MMTTPNLLILYVEDPARSAEFYERLLGRPPTASFLNFVSFDLGAGIDLGLWSIRAKDFVSSGSGHRSEVGFVVEDGEAVESVFKEWRAAGVTIEQAPMTAVFGRTFVALDPDGHRLRVCTPDR